jgi:hypothetical protein
LLLHEYRQWTLPILSLTLPEKTTPGATMLHGFVRQPTIRLHLNPVETADDIAFANAINHPPKSPLRDQPGEFPDRKEQL